MQKGNIMIVNINILIVNNIILRIKRKGNFHEKRSILNHRVRYAGSN